MARKNLLNITIESDDTTEETKEMSLDELIPAYGQAKEQLKILKDNTDQQNETIKNLMRKIAMDENGKRSKVSGEWTATLSVQDKSVMNEDRLIEWLKKNKLSKGIVKKKEYVDSDALEAAIYNGTITEKQVLDMEVCKDVKEVETLRVTKKKGK